MNIIYNATVVLSWFVLCPIMFLSFLIDGRQAPLLLMPALLWATASIRKSTQITRRYATLAVTVLALSSLLLPVDIQLRITDWPVVGIVPVAYVGQSYIEERRLEDRGLARDADYVTIRAIPLMLPKVRRAVFIGIPGRSVLKELRRRGD